MLKKIKVQKNKLAKMDFNYSYADKMATNLKE